MLFLDSWVCLFLIGSQYCYRGRLELYRLGAMCCSPLIFLLWIGSLWWSWLLRYSGLSDRLVFTLLCSCYLDLLVDTYGVFEILECMWSRPCWLQSVFFLHLCSHLCFGGKAHAYLSGFFWCGNSWFWVKFPWVLLYLLGLVMLFWWGGVNPKESGTVTSWKLSNNFKGRAINSRKTASPNFQPFVWLIVSFIFYQPPKGRFLFSGRRTYGN